MPVLLHLGNQNVFTATDDDARGQIFWRLTGDDADDFELSSTGLETVELETAIEPRAIVFKAPPDYEAPTDANEDSVYEVTLVARDSAGAEDMRPLTIFVTNVHEKGKATLTAEGDDPDQPLIDNMITAAVEDPDGGVAVITWQWQRSEDGATFEVIPGATMATYTPVTIKNAAGSVTYTDDGYFLRAIATYTDMTSEADDPDTDMDERVQKDEGGDTVAKTATTTDGTDDDDIGTNDPDRVYRVTVTSKNAVRVERARAGDPGDPVFANAPYEREVAENAEIGSIVGDPVRVVPETGVSFTYDLRATVSGDDDSFTIDNYGQIRVGGGELPRAAATADPTLDFEGKNEFVVIVTAIATVPTTRSSTAAVTISLRDLNESPYFDQVSRDTAAAAATDGMIQHTETQTNRVAALAATEPDGDGLRWEVTGPDADDFEIIDTPDRGGNDRVELDFKSQPDFENGKGSGELNGDANNNVYVITVRATETAALGNGPRKSDTLDIMVLVTNTDEKGTVEMKWLQPEVGTALPAILTDPDGPPGVEDEITVSSWRWYQAKVSNPNRNPDLDALDAEWAMIAAGTGGADSSTYTPQGDDADTEDVELTIDEGKHLLVTASYTDGESEPDDDPKMAFGISANPVRADVSDEDNNSPDFRLNETTRTVPENIAVGQPVGRPVMVDTNEDNDTLTYELDNDNIGENPVDTTGDVGYFSIDKATGQIRVAKKLSYEENVERPSQDDPFADGEYTVYVRATDPSGETTDEENQDEITVTIKATDVEEAPRVSSGARELIVDEQNGNVYRGLDFAIADGIEPAEDQVAGVSNLYLRTEEDLIDVQIWPEPISGDDGALFEYSTPDDSIGRRIHFINPPDYENPLDSNRDNVYELIIRTEDTTGLTGTRHVRVTVKNVNEAGKLVLGPEEPDDGMPVMATLTDPDGVVSITNWEWVAVSSRYATYAEALAAAAAATTDLDDTGIVLGATTDELTGAVGEFLWAMVDYRDGASEENDPVTTADERNDDDVDGSVVPNSDMMLDASTDNAVQKDPDAPGGPPPADPNDIEIERFVYENVPSTGYVGTPLTNLDYTGGSRDTIGGPDGTSFVFAENRDDSVDLDFYDEFMVSSDNILDDAGTADVDETDEDPNDKRGQLAANVVTQFNFEAGKNTYTIEVTDLNAVVPVGVVRVTITVLDVNEAPSAPSEFRGTPGPANVAPEFAAETMERSVAENTAAGENIGDPVTATDADDDELTYTLGGADMASFDIDGSHWSANDQCGLGLRDEERVRWSKSRLTTATAAWPPSW